MANKIDGLTVPFVPIGGVQGLPVKKPVSLPDRSPFRDLLAEKLAEAGSLRFSAHAQSRMQSRNISLDHAQLEQLSGALDQAKAKGGKNALVVMDAYAFIVNTDNRTVITAMDQEMLDENVFTNIDSAVIVNRENA